MIRKHRTPIELLLDGHRPIGYAKLRDGRAWAAAYDGFFAVVPLRSPESRNDTRSAQPRHAPAEPPSHGPRTNASGMANETTSDADFGASSTEPVVIDWSEFEGAQWEEADQTIRFDFVDNTQAPLIIILEDGTKKNLAITVRERLQRSIVFQMHDTLPSLSNARAMVRRNAHEELFTQIIIDGTLSPLDESRLEELETQLRDITGMPLLP